MAPSAKSTSKPFVSPLRNKISKEKKKDTSSRDIKTLELAIKSIEKERELKDLINRWTTAVREMIEEIYENAKSKAQSSIYEEEVTIKYVLKQLNIDPNIVGYDEKKDSWKS